MDENSNFEKFREAGRTEPGDAKKAWRLLAEGIDDASCPEWVNDYVRKSEKVIAACDVDRCDQALLAHQLGFYKEKEEQLTRAIYNRDDLFEWFVERMTQDAKQGRKIVVSRTAREYHEEVMKGAGEPESIRKAYEKARKTFNDRMSDEIEFQRALAETR